MALLATVSAARILLSKSTKGGANAGAGPGLHRHPYSETWIVRSGIARITADGQDIEAGPGDIIVVSPETAHKFKNIGDDRLDIICIHSCSRMIQEWLDEG